MVPLSAGGFRSGVFSTLAAGGFGSVTLSTLSGGAYPGLTHSVSEQELADVREFLDAQLAAL